MSKVILSLDGGGIRGAASSRFLEHVENTLKRDHDTGLRDCVDFYAGTSTGGIIALCLATTDMSVSDIAALYNEKTAAEIFAENRGLFEWDGVNAPKYEGKGKTGVLRDNMGSAKIRDVPDGKHVLAISYALEQRKPEVFKSTKDIHRELYAYQVADASSAAPTYFPTRDMEVGGEDEQLWLVDGGVIANNPTMCAIAEAKHAWGDISIDDMRVLSIGTGFQTRKINGPASRHWGALEWFVKGQIIDLLNDERVVAYQALTLTKPGSYIRVNSKLSPQPGLPNAPDDAMDDICPRNIKRLKALGDFWFDKYGEQAVQLLLDQYQGPSLDRIDAQSGEPIRQS